MPKRKDNSSAGRGEAQLYAYEEVLKYIRKHIDEEQRGVSKFLHSDKYLGCGFKDSPNERAKMFTYLSLPAEGETARVKSFPVMKKLYKGLLGVELVNKIKVIRTQMIESEFVLD